MRNAVPGPVSPLAPAAIEAFFAEAARVLKPGGLVTIASLTFAARGLPRLISSAWLRVWRFSPRLTGGCRPVDLAAHLPAGWSVLVSQDITSYAITSGLQVARQPTG